LARLVEAILKAQGYITTKSEPEKKETGIPVQNDRIYRLTKKGRAFIKKWPSAKNRLEPQ
jgi:DNA-binding PadR family transcriptional regulator